MKLRSATATFIKSQLSDSYTCPKEKDGCFRYGWQELRCLMDFIYGGEPTTKKQEIGRKK